VAATKAEERSRPETAGVEPVVSARKLWAARAILVIAVCAAYANSLHGPFIFDDGPSILDNRSIRQLELPRALVAPPKAVTVSGRPVVNLSLAVNYAIGGLTVEGYHWINLALHVLAALAVFALTRRTLRRLGEGPPRGPSDPPRASAAGQSPPALTRRPTMAGPLSSAATGLALTVALLWACHPLQTESVTYIVQRAEVIVGLFYLLTLYCFLRGATSSNGKAWYAAAVGACALGMASKEVMVSAPLMTVLYDRTFVAGSFKQSLRRRWRLWLALSATWALLPILYGMSGHRGGSAGFGLGMTAWQYARTQLGSIVHYLRLAFWPSPLVLDYGALVASSAAEVVPYALVVLLLVAATIAALVLRPRWGFLGAWFFVILAPSSSIVPLATQTAAEHRMYLPLLAVVAMVVFATYPAIVRLGLRSKRAPVWATVLPVLALTSALMWRTHQRNQDYQSELAIWDANIRAWPLSDRAYLTRGSVYWTLGRYDDAIKDYDRSIALNPRSEKAYIGRGNVYSDRGQYDEALRDYDLAINLNPRAADAYNGRGSVYDDQGQIDLAIRDFSKAIELEPEFAEAYFNRAVARDAKGELDAAIEDYDKVIRLQPTQAQAYAGRGIARSRKGEIDAAISDYDRAIALRPDFAEAYSNRGNARQSKGQYREAISDYEKAIALRPRFVAPYQNRAIAYTRLGEYDKAWEDVAMIRRLDGTPIPSFVADLARKSGRTDKTGLP
jgi:tetratricopeptide (TPR) repeat protein